MRKMLSAAALFLLAACAAQPEPTGLTRCSEPRPQVCTMEYAPVCATLTAGGQKEHASSCNACADDAVTGYVSGMCPE